MHAVGDSRFPEPFFFPVTMSVPKQSGDSGVVQSHPFPILLPHEVFAFLYREAPSIFYDIFMSGSSDPNILESFWTEVAQRRDPRIRYHSQCKRSDWLRRAIPYTFHGDAVPCVGIGRAGSKSLDVYSYQGILTDTTSKASNLYCFGIFEHNKVKSPDVTSDCIWKVLSWSLAALFEGCWPRTDPFGSKHDANSPDGAPRGD